MPEFMSESERHAHGNLPHDFEPPKEYIRSPTHVLRCIGELATMYLKEQSERLEQFMDEAMDVWGEEE